MKTKFTKEKWYSTFNSNKERGVRTSGGFICFLPKPFRYTGQKERHEQELGEYKANAKLIASAPELLECLDYVLGSMSLERTENFDLMNRCKKAIKKATE